MKQNVCGLIPKHFKIANLEFYPNFKSKFYE